MRPLHENIKIHEHAIYPILDKFQAENSRQVLKQLPELELPDIVCGINTLRLQSKPTAQQLELQRMMRESQSLIEARSNFILLRLTISSLH